MSTKDQDGGLGRHEEHGGTMGGAWVSFLGSPGTEITSDGTYMFCLYTTLPLPTLCPALQATGPASLRFKFLPGQARLEAAPTGRAAMSCWGLMS